MKYQPENISQQLEEKRKLKQFSEAHDINDPWLAWQLIIIISACCVFVMATVTLIIRFSVELLTYAKLSAKWVNDLPMVVVLFASIFLLAGLIGWKIIRSGKAERG